MDRKLIAVVHSGDQSSWMWDEWHENFAKNWTEKIPAIFLTEEKTFHTHKNITVIRGGAGWFEQLDHCFKRLQMMGYTDIIYLHEDYFLTEPVDAGWIEELYEVFKEQNLDILKMYDIRENMKGRTRRTERTGVYVKNKELKEYHTSNSYVISHGPSIWSIDFFKKTIRKGMKALGGHELQKSTKKIRDAKVWCNTGVRQPIQYLETIIQGRIRENAQKFFSAEKIADYGVHELKKSNWRKNKKPVILHISPNPFMSLFEEYAKDRCTITHGMHHGVDMIYCGNVSRLTKALEIKKKFNKPVVCWVWDVCHNWREWIRGPKNVKGNLFRDERLKKYIKELKQCDLVISASKYTQKVLASYGINSEQIYFYIDTHGIDKVQAGHQGDHIVQISRFFFNKKFGMTMKAAKQVDHPFILIGQNKGFFNRLRRKAPKNVQLLLDIQRGKTVGILKSSRMLVSPSVFEGWGITPIEALYCGKPVVLSDIEPFREVYGDSVVFHEKENIPAMVDKIKYVIDNPQVGEKMVEDCQPIISDFTPEKFADRWFKLMRQL